MRERIETIKEYFVAFNIAENVAYILINLPSKWEVPDNSILEENFNTKTAKESDGKIYFFSSLSNGINNVFDAVEFVIEYNKDIEEKSIIFIEKINKLKEIFAEKTLDELRRLEMVIKEETSVKQTKRQNKKTKKVKNETKVKETKNDDKSLNDNIENFNNNNNEQMNNGESLIAFAERMIEVEE